MNYEGEARSVSASSRQVLANTSKASDYRIDDLSRLTLGQSNNAPPASNPLKRSAGLQPLSDSRSRGDNRAPAKTRRTRVPSTSHDASEYDRGKSNPPSGTLYDPRADTTTFGKSHSSPRSTKPTSFGSKSVRDPVGRGTQHHHSHSQPQHLHHQPRQHQHHHSAGSSNAHQNTAGILHAEPTLVEEPPGQDDWDEDEPELLLQPETRPISHEQLVTEVKAIYSGLVLVETKCIDIDEKQLRLAQDSDPSKRTPLTPEQWSALTALHKTLLHEHHDFFLASQHPAASEALTKLAEKYSMPARMWKHGIHAFLEVLRHHLPNSFDFMITFLNISYSMMALLYETVPMFEDTWIECLGDLGRYRMALGDIEQRDRDTWASVARLWYGKAANKHPQIGRLYHHLGILAKPYSISQFSLYCRSLSANEPYYPAKSSLMTAIRPILAGQLSPAIKYNASEISLIKCLGDLFTGRSSEDYLNCCSKLLDQGGLNKYCDRAATKLKEVGVSISISVLSGLLEFGATRPDGSSTSIIRRAYESIMLQKAVEAGTIQDTNTKQSHELTAVEQATSRNYLTFACRIAFGTFAVGLDRYQDRHIIPLIHCFTAFLATACSHPQVIAEIEMDIPWAALVAYLNYYTTPGTMTNACLGDAFPKVDGEAISRPLPEDFLMYGQILWFGYFPATFFSAADVDDEEKLLELPSMASPRLSRILWNGQRIAKLNKWISYDHATFRFSETDYARSLVPREMPASFEPSTLPPDLVKLVPPPSEAEAPVPSPRIKTESMDRDDFKSSGAPRQVFTQTPQILKRESKPETFPTTRPSDASPTKLVTFADSPQLVDETMDPLYERSQDV